jgi:hypothetical protein
MNIKRTTKNFILTTGLVGVLGFTGCMYNTDSCISHESAVVVDKYHTDAYSTPVRVGKMMSVINHPAVNRVTFDGNIDFVVDNKDLYKKLNVGDSVNVTYNQVYRIVDSEINLDDRSGYIKLRLKGCEFIDAVKK